MPTKLNPEAVTYAKQLIREGKVRHDADHWHEHNPDTEQENAFIAQHNIQEYGKWHLGIDSEAGEDTKGRYKFPFGDFKTVHRDGLIAVKQRAAQQGYHDIEQAAEELERELDNQK